MTRRVCGASYRGVRKNQIRSDASSTARLLLAHLAAAVSNGARRMPRG